MISAKEAKRKALLQTDYRRYKDEIEKQIEKAISDGLLFVRIRIDFMERAYEKEIIEIISRELELLGYRTQYNLAKPISHGCSSEQCDNYSYFYVSWED